jgi:hypothetical protein
MRFFDANGQVEFKLKGWGAVAVAVLLLSIGGYQLIFQNQTLPTEGVQKIRAYLYPRYATYYLDKIDDPGSPPDAGQKAMGQLAAFTEEDIKIESIRARGRKRNLVVRVEVSVKGEDPPRGERVLYLHMRRSKITGWRVVSKAFRWQFIL